MNAVIYARFSSDRQSEMSIDAQVRACCEYAEKKNITILDIYKDEAVSGTTANRISYQQMLSDAIEGKFDAVLIHKYDRIARNLEEQVMLRKRFKQLNIKLIAVAQDYGEGKDAELSKGIQWVLGEYYSANLAEETRKGHKEIALKGMHNGGVAPFGYDIIDQKYVINELEARYVRRFFEYCVNGKEYKELLDEMASLGIVGKRGKPIKYTQIYEMLHNEKYTGTYVYSPIEEENRADRRSKPNAIRIENAFEPIVSKDLYNQVQICLAEHKHAAAQKHPCSGLVYCQCGAKMHIARSTNKGHTYVKFRCSQRCGMKGVDVDVISDAVDKYLNVLFSENTKEQLTKALEETRLDAYKQNITFEQKKKADLDKKEKELKNITEALMSGAFEGNYEYCNKLITDKRLEIETLKNIKPAKIDTKSIKNWVDNVAENKNAPKVFIKRIEVTSDGLNIISTFDVVGNVGCGGSIDMFPQILYGQKIYSRC